MKTSNLEIADISQKYLGGNFYCQMSLTLLIKLSAELSFARCTSVRQNTKEGMHMGNLMRGQNCPGCAKLQHHVDGNTRPESVWEPPQ